MSKQKQSKYYIYLAGWLSLIINLLLFFLKFWAGIVTNSVAIIADAWHTLSDSVTSVIVLTGTKLSHKPPDEQHPYGHGRIELIGSIVIGVLLAVVGVKFLFESIEKLNNNDFAEYNVFAIVITTVSVLVKEALAQYAIRTGNKHNSSSLKADGWHHRSDAITSVIILIGILFGNNFWWIDGVLGILVALIILYASYEILKDAINPLIGEKPDKKMVNDIKKVIYDTVDREINFHNLCVHQYGNHTEITFNIKLPDTMKLKEAHDIAEKIEIAIKEKLDITATIHMEPM